ncbi:MAG: peptide-methionine (R)-S-oxide reductase MsrB [Candidatus Sumerlaeia bacterium]
MPSEPADKSARASAPATDRIEKSDEEWRKILTPEQFNIMRRHGTEPAFCGQFWNTKDPGTYVCAACGQPLFKSTTKFNSGTGWPSYTAPITTDAVGTRTDHSLGMTRIEVHCKRCGGHLGHVFDDGPPPTGLRYCINSAALKFQPER